MKIYDGRVNHLDNPLGYSLGEPVFSWKVKDAAGTRQTQARLRVWCAGGELADTGWADLDWLGTKLSLALEPCTRYSWTVAVRTDAGEEGESAPHWFETGKMAQPWQGGWIGCPEGWAQNGRHPVFSKAVQPEKPLRAARLYICGLGLYEAAWNGEKIGRELLTPYCTNYDSWVQYQTFDLTEQIRGAGVLSVTLGNGWYLGRYGAAPPGQPPFRYGSRPQLMAELQLYYTDGTVQRIGTDPSWQLTGSNITFSGLYDGEHRDDTLPPLAPQPAVAVPPPQGKLTARYSTPVLVREELNAVLLHTPAGETVLDIGQNQAGIFRLRVKLPRGSVVHLQFGEILQNGNFYRGNLGSARAEYWYRSDGQPHILEPKFTCYGYRYVKVEGIPDLDPADFTALCLYSELPAAGRLETGHPKVNRLIANAAWGQKSNFIDLPTDCPQRDERLGWTGDAQIFAPTACYLRDSTAFFIKYLRDLHSEQEMRDGMVPVVVPSAGMQFSSAAWGDTACILPWTLYQFTGDREILARCYPGMTAWLNYIAAKDRGIGGWAMQFHFGDWLALDARTPGEKRGGTDVALVALCYYRRSLLLTARTAGVLGKEEEAARWREKADVLREKIRQSYFTPAGRCIVNTQTALLLALQDELSPNRAVSEQQLREILAEGKGMLQTGFVGTPLLCPTLTRMGDVQAAFHLLLNEDYPGWLYAVNLGATTVWERWDSVGRDGRIAPHGMNSLNHYAYGSVVAWIFSDVAGLAPLEPGFRRALLAPHCSRALGHLTAEYESAAGHWQIGWKIVGERVHYRCTVPFDCTARLCLPDGSSRELGPGTFEVEWALEE